MLVLASTPRLNWLLFPHQLTLSGTTIESPPWKAKQAAVLSPAHAGQQAHPSSLPHDMGATAPVNARQQEPESVSSTPLFSSTTPVQRQQQRPFQPPPVAKAVGDTRPQKPHSLQSAESSQDMNYEVQKSHFPAHRLSFLSAVSCFSLLTGGSSSLLQQAVLLNHALRGKQKLQAKRCCFEGGRSTRG